MYFVCNVTYVLVEYSVGLNKKLNYVLLSLPAIYLLWSIKKMITAISDCYFKVYTPACSVQAEVSESDIQPCQFVFEFYSVAMPKIHYKIF